MILGSPRPDARFGHPEYLDRIGFRALLGLAIAGFGITEIGQVIVRTGGWGAMPAFWPALGLLLAFLLVTEPRRWAFLACLLCTEMALSDVMHGSAASTAAIAAVLRGGEACAAAWLVRRLTGGPLALDRLPHSLVLILAASTIPVVGGLLATNLLPIADTAAMPARWGAWYLADTLGMITTAPLAVSVLTTRPAAILAQIRGWRALEIACALAGAVVVIDGVFGGRLAPWLRVPAFMLPFILWPALRFGPGASAAATFILCFIALSYSARGEGPAAVLGPTRALLRAQAGMVLTGASLLILATVVAERRRVARERDVLVKRLQRALAEIKTLRGFIPICAWCHRIRDDAGCWHELEEYLDQRTDATFSHGICPGCVEEQTGHFTRHGTPAV